MQRKIEIIHRVYPLEMAQRSMSVPLVDEGNGFIQIIRPELYEFEKDVSWFETYHLSVPGVDSLEIMKHIFDVPRLPKSIEFNNLSALNKIEYLVVKIVDLDKKNC